MTNDTAPLNPILYKVNTTYQRLHDVLVRWEERNGVTDTDRPNWVWLLFHDLDMRCMDMEDDTSL